MTDEQLEWPLPWVRAALGTAALACLEHEDLHGYAIAERLAERGFGRPKGGSLYPLLSALEESGAVDTAWAQGEKGPGRRTYTLTDAGRARLASERESWAALVHSLAPRSEHVAHDDAPIAGRHASVAAPADSTQAGTTPAHTTSAQAEER